MWRSGARLTEFQYQTLKSWTLVAGHRQSGGLRDKDNPRFIVTNLAAEGLTMTSPRLIASALKSAMKTFTVRAATWKTRSSSSIWIWTPIAPAPTGWRVISYSLAPAFASVRPD